MLRVFVHGNHHSFLVLLSLRPWCFTVVGEKVTELIRWKSQPSVALERVGVVGEHGDLLPYVCCPVRDGFFPPSIFSRRGERIECALRNIRRCCAGRNCSGTEGALELRQAQPQSEALILQGWQGACGPTRKRS